MSGIFGLFGFGVPMHRWGNRRDGSSTADGGRPTNLDRMFDNDGPLPEPGPYTAKPAREASRQFRVTLETRCGGTGLYHGPETDDEE
jgi:hypothetical protein